MNSVSSLELQELAVKLGERLRHAREQLGMSQEDLGAALGLAGRSVQRYEAGGSTLPSDTVFKLKDLGIDPGYLFNGLQGSAAAITSATTLDMDLLKEIVEWVDNEWSAGKPMNELDRIAWILQEYLASVYTAKISFETSSAPKSGLSRAA